MRDSSCLRWVCRIFGWGRSFGPTAGSRQEVARRSCGWCPNRLTFFGDRCRVWSATGAGRFPARKIPGGGGCSHRVAFGSGVLCGWSSRTRFWGEPALGQPNFSRTSRICGRAQPTLRSRFEDRGGLARPRSQPATPVRAEVDATPELRFVPPSSTASVTARSRRTWPAKLYRDMIPVARSFERGALPARQRSA